MCGIFGMYGSISSSQYIHLGLHALQHRGQESAGIVTNNYNPKTKSSTFNAHMGFGLVTDVFRDSSKLEKLKGQSGIGHTRYSTTGGVSITENIQPIYGRYKSGHISIGHNGNLSNSKTLRKKIVGQGVVLKGSSDTEIILHLIAKSQADSISEQVREALMQVEGAYTLVILTEKGIIATRDPKGFRPLCLGKLTINGESSYVVSSESCAFDIISAEYVREIEPGEILSIDKDGLKTTHLPKTKSRARCCFEYVYFSRPDSFIFGESVDKVRRRLGKSLAKEHPVSLKKDEIFLTVISIPDSSNTHALGYTSESNKNNTPARFEIGLIRNHYSGRTFTLPSEENRAQKVRAKFNYIKGILKGRRVVVVDDSIVRGTTVKELIRLLKEALPNEIHIRIASPPVISNCYYGIDISNEDQLIAVKNESNIKALNKSLGSTSLEYLSLKNLLACMPKYEGEEESFCTACFSKKYPTNINGVTTHKNEND